MKSEQPPKKMYKWKRLFLSYEHIHILYIELFFREKYYADLHAKNVRDYYLFIIFPRLPIWDDP